MQVQAANHHRRFVPLTLRHNFSWNVAGNVLYTLCQWGMLVVLAKMGNPGMVGQFTLGFAVVAPILLCTGLQLRAVQATDAQGDYQLGDYLSLRLLGISLAFCIIVGIVWIVPYPPLTKGIILTIAIAKAFESVSEILHGFFQLCERMDRIARSLMIKGPLSLLLLIVGLRLTDNVLGGVIGLAIAWGTVLWFHDLRVARSLLQFAQTTVSPDPARAIPHIRPTWRWKTLGKLLALTWPLGLVILLISLNVNIPRYFLEFYEGDHTLGIFAAMAYMPLAGDMIVNALGQSASPRLAQYYAAGDRKSFIQLLAKLLGIVLVMGLTGLLIAQLAGREILTFFYRPEFAQQSAAFVLLVGAASLGYLSSVLGYSMTALRRFRVQLPIFCWVTASTAVLCYLWIPTQGLTGAVLALMTAVGTQLLMSTGIVAHTLLHLHHHPQTETHAES